jgi:membrane protein YdbS with pleckstrin-like domain
MIDPNRILSYITISVILLFGIAVMSGIYFDFPAKYRIAIGVMVGLYVLARVYLLFRGARPKSMIKYKD